MQKITLKEIEERDSKLAYDLTSALDFEEGQDLEDEDDEELEWEMDQMFIDDVTVTKHDNGTITLDVKLEHRNGVKEMVEKYTPYLMNGGKDIPLEDLETEMQIRIANLF